MKNKLKRLLLSRFTAFCLVALIGILCLIGDTIPQVGSVSPSFYHQWESEHPNLKTLVETLHFNRMYTSEIFLGTVTLLLLAMSYSLYHVFSAVRRKDRKTVIRLVERAFRHFFAFKGTLLAPKTLLNEAQKRGYHYEEISESLLRLRKYAFSRWGTSLLHLGMLIVVATGMLTFLFEQRGFVQLLEGDTFFGSRSDFLSVEQGPFARKFAPDLSISLARFTPEYYPKGDIKSLESSVLLGKHLESLSSVALSVNHPLNIGGAKIYQSTSFGFTVCLVLERNGQSIPAYFSLDHPRKLGKPYVGYSDFPTSGYLLTMELTPDPTSGTFQLHNPALRLIVEEQGVVRFSGMLKTGDSIQLSGETLSFKDVRHWTGLIVTENKFVPLSFLGFALVILGLLLIYVFPMREIYVAIEPQGESVWLTLGGTTRRDHSLFAEEFNALAESIYLKEGVLDVRTDLVEI